MKVTVDELDVFQACGPTYLCKSGSDPWNHPTSARAVMACLVQAVYALDKDMSLARLGLNPLAPDWHVPFGYKVVKVVREEQVVKEGASAGGKISGRRDAGGSGEDEEKGGGEGAEAPIVGAVFRWSRRMSLLRPRGAPKVVVAFRGTLLRELKGARADLGADLRILMLQLHDTPRFRAAKAAAQEAVALYGASKVWLAGHSLGAAVCLLVGRTIAESSGGSCLLQAHLFNPPFPSFDLHSNHLFKAFHSLAVSIARATSGDDQPPSTSSGVSDDTSAPAANIAAAAQDPLLTHWLPHLYVNPHDPICSSYTAYFHNLRTDLHDHHPHHVDRSGPSSQGHGSQSGFNAPASLRALLSHSSMAFHLIPSAHLHVNTSMDAASSGFLKAHGMKQWWSQDSQIQSQPVGFASQHWSSSK